MYLNSFSHSALTMVSEKFSSMWKSGSTFGLQLISLTAIFAAGTIFSEVN